MSQNTNLKAYYKKSAFFVRITRYIVTLLLIFFVIACLIVFRSDVTIENIQLLSKFITLDDGSSLLYGGEFSVISSDDSESFMLRDNLGIVNGSNFSLYYLSGQKLFSYDLAYSSPAVVFNNHNILIYDVGGKGASIFNSFSKIKSFDFDYPIRSAFITKDHLAVLTNDDSHYSVVAVYEFISSENNYVETFRYLSSESYVTSIALSDDGSRLLISAADSKNGSYYSSVSVFDVYSSSQSPLYKAEVNDELPIKVCFSKDAGGAFVITDSGIIFYDASLKETDRYKFNQSKTEDFFIGDDLIAITERNNLSGNSMLISGLDTNGKLLFTLSADDEIYDIAFAKNKIFALGDGGVYEFTKKNDGQYSRSGFSALSSRYNTIVSDTDGNCYVVGNSYVKRIDFNEG